MARNSAASILFVGTFIADDILNYVLDDRGQAGFLGISGPSPPKPRAGEGNLGGFFDGSIWIFPRRVIFACLVERLGRKGAELIRPSGNVPPIYPPGFFFSPRKPNG